MDDKIVIGKIQGPDNKNVVIENVPNNQLVKGTSIIQEELLAREHTIPMKLIERTKKWILTYFQEKGKFPGKVWLSKKVNISAAKTTGVIQVLLNEGFLLKKSNRYYLAAGQKENISFMNSIKKVKKSLRVNPGILILKICMFLIGCGATYMSIFHSIGFLSEYYIGYRSVMAAIIMIVFNILAAEMIVFFWKKGYKALCGAFSILLVLGTIFSMGSTVIGLYNSRSKDIVLSVTIENEETHVLQETKLDYQNILDSKAQAEANLIAERIKRDNLVEILKQYNTPEKIKENQTDYNNLNWTRVLADRGLVKIQEKYDIILEEEKQFLKIETVTTKHKKELPNDAFTWIGNAVNVEPDKLQFMLSCYPAIFYDIIAPVAFSIVLFVTSKPKKKKKKISKKRRKK